MRVFRYLKPGEGRAADEVLAVNYPEEDLVRRLVVIRDGAENVYRVFDSWREFWDWRATTREDLRCFDEVVFGAAPQRLKFDIDAEETLLAQIPEEVFEKFTGERLPATTPRAKAEALVAELLEIVLEELACAWYSTEDIRPALKDLAVADSSGPTGRGEKFSYHVIVLPYAVADNEEAKGFTAQVLDRLPPAVRRLVDFQVNKSVQNFRLAGSTKPGSARVKTPTTAFGTAAAAMTDLAVRAEPGARVLSRAFTEPPGDKQAAPPARDETRLGEMASDDLADVVAFVGQQSPAAQHHRFHRVQGSLLLYRRTAPGGCAICGRRHEKDNTLMVAVEPAPDGAPGADAKTPHRVYEICRRKTGERRLLGLVSIRPREVFAAKRPALGRDARAVETGLGLAARLGAIAEGRVDVHRSNASAFEELPAGRQSVYSEERMRPYEAVPTLVVKGQMKLGKTKALRDYIDRLYPAAPVGGPVVRMVTFRQTFSKSMQREAFKDFALYSDHKGDLGHARFPRLIVQLESLWRIPMPEAPEPVDLLVLDEVESILAQFDSGLHKNFNASFAMFGWMVATAGRVVCMDANVGDRTLRVLEKMRGHAPAFFHWNRYQRAAGDKYFFTEKKGEWLSGLHGALAGGKKVVVPMNSLAEAEAVAEGIRSKFPEKAVRLYSSRTPVSEKDRDFADVHRYWSGLDALIYTPTLSAGVSYELPHFDTLYGHFSDSSCDVETCRQMLARVRNLRTREHYIFLSGRRSSLPTSAADIRRLLYNKRANLYRELNAEKGHLALQFTYDARGEICYHESPYFWLWLETRRVENLSKNNFVARFVDQVADTGAAVGPFPRVGENDAKDLARLHKDTKEGLTEARAAAVAAAPLISGEEAEEIRKRCRQQEDVSADEMDQLARFRLCQVYQWHGRPVDSAFVKVFQTPEAVRVFRNLTDIAQAPRIADSLRLIQAREQGVNMGFMGDFGFGALMPPGVTGESRDLSYKYFFQAHYFAVGLLYLVGFRCITDENLLHESAVARKVSTGLPVFLESLPMIATEFEIKRPPKRESFCYEDNPQSLVLKVVAFANKALRKMYGIEIQKKRNEYGSFLLFLARYRIGKKFNLIRPEDELGDSPYPCVRSRLTPVAFDPVGLFMITQIYDVMGFDEDDVMEFDEDGGMGFDEDGGMGFDEDGGG